MRSLRVALAQVNPTVGDLEGNAALIRKIYDRARASGADLVAFPELALTGYPPEDLLLKQAFVRQNHETITELARALKPGPVAVIGFVDRAEGHLYNAAAVVSGGRLRGVYHKVLLPNYGVFDEKRYFEPGSTYPVFVVRGVQVGITICEDAWVGDGPVRASARAGAEVVVNINASPYHQGKSFERQVLFRQRALENKVHFCYVQTVGGQDELVFNGDSLVYDPRGKLLARGSQFEEDLITVDLQLAQAPKRIPAKATALAISKTPRRPPTRPLLPSRKPRLASSPIEEIYGALLLGTRDYIRKNGFDRAVIGLSGGIDSSLTAVIAADAIGAENVLGVAMPSQYSSRESLEDAKALATNLGVDFRVVPIDNIFNAFLEELSEHFSGREPDIAEENLQSRIRGTTLMAFTNKFGGIVLTTGNKSEMATGYSTLYGDMAGGFAVLKDITKTLVYELASWRNSWGPAAIPDRVFTKAPSAELRPGQLDTDSLPPYETLDPILVSYIEDERSIREMIDARYPEDVVRRIVEMVDRSEYKRRQSPPGIKITHRAFGKDRRLPITNRFRQRCVPVTARVQGKGKR